MICFIPARCGSSLKDKNIKEISGKPLLVWTIEKALEANVGRVIVNTDSEEYARIAKEAGAEVMIRDENLARDDTPMYEVLKNEIPKITPLPDKVMILQPTYFPRSVETIQRAVRSLTIDDSLISVKRIPEEYHPAVAIVETPEGYGMALGNVPISQRITRRQDHPNAFVPTGEIYLFKTNNLDKGNFYGERVMLLEVDNGGININDEEDLIKAEELCK